LSTPFEKNIFWGYCGGKQRGDMGTPYSYPSDQSRLIVILGLDRYQYDSDSLLRTLMDDQMDWDAQRGLDTVALVLTAMTSWEALNTEYQSELTKQSVKHISVTGEYLQINDTPIKDTFNSRLDSIRSRILKLLDPDRQLFQIQGGTQSRVFVT